MKTHLITGAGSGIGAAIADRLHARGDLLVLPTRSSARGDELVDRWPGSMIVVAELSDPEAAEMAFAGADLPPLLDSVVHSAGVADMSPTSEAKAAMWTSVLAVNLVSPAVITAACLPAVRRAKGTVVFINSGAGLTSHPNWSPYGASKFGLKALADALRGEEHEHGVRVTTVFPGRTATPMQEALHESEGNPYDPDRWIQPESVAKAVIDVIDLSPDASHSDITIRPTI